MVSCSATQCAVGLNSRNARQILPHSRNLTTRVEGTSRGTPGRSCHRLKQRLHFNGGAVVLIGSGRQPAAVNNPPGLLSGLSTSEHDSFVQFLL